MSVGDDAMLIHKEIPTGAIRLLTIRHGLKAEIRGMRLTRKAPSCLTICKKEFGIKAKNAATALPLFDALLLAHGFDFSSKDRA